MVSCARSSATKTANTQADTERHTQRMNSTRVPDSNAADNAGLSSPTGKGCNAFKRVG